MSARFGVRVRPGARADRLLGRLADGTLKLEVREPPEGGRANEAVVELIAALLGIRSGQVAVVRGRTSRGKLVEVDGLDGAEVTRRMEAALQRQAADGE